MDTKFKKGKNHILYKHGLSYHPLYKLLIYMKNRCYSPNNTRYKNYGGRGIKICKEWLDSPKAFVNWALANGYKKGLQIDRADNDGDYEPSNCRFVINAVNNQNRGDLKLNWDLVHEIRNAKLLIPELSSREIARAYGVSHNQILAIWHNKSWKE